MNMADLRTRRLGWSRIRKMNNMSDTKNDFNNDEDLNWDWRRYMENKERMAQAKDIEMAKRFWDERP
jgi:hypothetical protein